MISMISPIYRAAVKQIHRRQLRDAGMDPNATEANARKCDVAPYCHHLAVQRLPNDTEAWLVWGAACRGRAWLGPLTSLLLQSRPLVFGSTIP